MRIDEVFRGKLLQMFWVGTFCTERSKVIYVQDGGFPEVEQKIWSLFMELYVCAAALKRTTTPVQMAKGELQGPDQLCLNHGSYAAQFRISLQ